MKEIFLEFCQSNHYSVGDYALFQQALTHRSFSKDHNERLEFLGDAVLDTIISEALFKKSYAPEGELSRYRSLLVQGSMLSEISLELELDKLIRLGSGEEKSGGRQRESIMANVFEAVLGAVYLDLGFTKCQELVLNLYSSRLRDLEHLAEKKDPKTALQELLQKMNLGLPKYQLVKTTGEQHQQQFFVSCQVPNMQLTSEAFGASKKKSEQLAAKSMLELLQEKVNK